MLLLQVQVQVEYELYLLNLFRSIARTLTLNILSSAFLTNLLTYNIIQNRITHARVFTPFQLSVVYYIQHLPPYFNPIIKRN